MAPLAGTFGPYGLVSSLHRVDVGGTMMNASGKIMKWAVALAAVGLVAACGGTSGGPAASPKPSISAPAGPERFLAKVRAIGFGSKDFANATDAQLLKVGQTVCNGFGPDGVGYQDEVLAFVQNSAHPTTHQAAVLVDEAVRNLCPRYAAEIPAGAP